MTRFILDEIDLDHCVGKGQAVCASLGGYRRRGAFNQVYVVHKCRQTGALLSVSVNGRVQRCEDCPYGVIRDVQEMEVR